MSMLRSSKFIKYFVSFARSIAINQPRGVDGTLIQKSKSLISTNRLFATRSLNDATKTIDRSIQRLDQDVRRSGRISFKELQDVFNEIRTLKHATSTQSLLLIRCCGNLVPEERPEVRMKLVNEIWETLDNLGVPFDISHYNALLRVYIENDHQFLPTEFLTRLELKGIEPNRVTFQRLITFFCQNGDIDGAKSILEFMKEKQLPVNENVFNSLIIGHSQCNDMESAVGMISVMKQANLQPSSETYTVLMCGYAKQGDIDSINNIMKQCQSNEIILSAKEILDIIYALVINKHAEHLPIMLNILKEKEYFNQDAKNTILRLLNKGEEQAALEILKTMPLNENENTSTGNFLIKHVVRSNRPFETIMWMCNEIKKLGNTRAISVATEASLTSDNSERSLKLLEILSQEEAPCMHYYWPVLVQYGKSNNKNGVISTLKQIVKEVGHPPSLETLKDYVFPFFDNQRLGEEGIVYLRQGGVSVGAGASALVGYLLSRNKIKEAAQIGLRFKANYNSQIIRRALVASFLVTKDVPSFATLVQIMESNDSEDVEAGGRVLLDVVHNLKTDRNEILPEILDKYLEHGIGITTEVAELIQNKLGHELTPEISNLLTQLTSSELSLTEVVRPALKIRRAEHSEAYLLNIIKTNEEKGENTKGVQKQLLVLYCQNRDFDKAIQLRDQLIKDGFVFNRVILASLFDLFVHHEKLDDAIETMNMLRANDPDFVISSSKPIKLAMLMHKLDRFDDAIDLLKKYAPEEPGSEFFTTTNAWKFLNALAESGDVEKLQKLFDTLIECNYVVPNNVLLGPLVKVHLLKDDIENSLSAFENCCDKYKATPWKNEIACKLIEKEDSTNLQRLTDLSTQIHGEVNSLYDLVLSFVECGRIRQARKILETPGLRTKTQRIHSACERYRNEGRVKDLENLVEVTKDLKHIDRADIYQHLLNTYDKNDDVDKALGLWTQMQDEDVQPSDQFLVTLGELLKKHNRPVPFQIPRLILHNTVFEEKPADVSSSIKLYRRALNGKDVDEALNLIQNKLKPDEVSNSDKSRLLVLMVECGRVGEASKFLLNWLENGFKPTIKSLSIILNNLAKIGDIDNLNTIGKLIDPELKRMISFSNRQTHCMVEAGRGEEVLNKLTEEIKSAKTDEEIQLAGYNFPQGGIFSILSSHPEFLPKFEELAEIYRSKGILGPTNALWVHTTLTGDNEKAEEAWKYLKPEEKLLFQPILKAARFKNDIKLVDDLIERCQRAHAKGPFFGVIFSCKIDILMKNDLTQAENALEEGLKLCPIEYFNRSTLFRLKTALEVNGKQFKYTIPGRRLISKDSSSSSSSDSDEETQATAKN